MKSRPALVLGLSLIASWVFFGVRRGFAERPVNPMVRIAELEIDPHQLEAYEAALKEEITASIEREPGVLTLYAVSVKGHPEQIRLFETYRNPASYEAHLQSAHFKKYKEQTRRMVKSLKLIETEPILLGAKSK